MRNPSEILKSLKSPKELLAALGGACIFAALASRLIVGAASLHWILGMFLAAAFGALALWFVKSVASQPGFQSIETVLTFFAMSVLLATVACAGISYILYTRGWAAYHAPTESTINTFIRYYAWTLLDMVPVIGIWKTLPVKAAVEATNAIAGIPVLGFKLFILGVIFNDIRRWWKNLRSIMWPEEIESAYQSWISCRELFHPNDFKHFAKFLWTCIDNPSGAPNEVQFRERLVRDRNLVPDELGFPHPTVQKAQMLFTYLPDLLRYKPMNEPDEKGKN